MTQPTVSKHWIDKNQHLTHKMATIVDRMASLSPRMCTKDNIDSQQHATYRKQWRSNGLWRLCRAVAQRHLGAPPSCQKISTNYRFQNYVGYLLQNRGQNKRIRSNAYNSKHRNLFVKLLALNCQFVTAVCMWAYSCLGENEAWLGWLQKHAVVKSH